MLDSRAFWFLRHGETDWNKQGLAQGRVETALNQTGLDQARNAAQLLMGQGVTLIFTSPLLRARLTAEIAGEALGAPVQIESELMEAAFGDHEGQPMGPWFDEWTMERFTPPGGESFAALRRRAVRAVNRCLAAAAPEGLALVVAHGSFMRALRAEMGLECNVRTQNAAPIHCAPGKAGAAGWELIHGKTLS